MLLVKCWLSSPCLIAWISQGYPFCRKEAICWANSCKQEVGQSELRHRKHSTTASWQLSCQMSRILPTPQSCQIAPLRNSLHFLALTQDLVTWFPGQGNSWMFREVLRGSVQPVTSWEPLTITGFVLFLTVKFVFKSQHFFPHRFSLSHTWT